MKRKVITIVACLLLIVGIAVLLYPHVRQQLYKREVQNTIEMYDKRVSALESAGAGAGADADAESAVDLSGLYAAMQAYNEDLFEDGQEGFRDAWSYQEPSFDLSEWGLEDDMVGYLDVPRMGVSLPIYLGASEENMLKGAVHLTQTSLPIGGLNTNCVIAAHRDYPVAAMFRDIEDMQLGDEITITNLWETLSYRVVEAKVIDPSDVTEVMIQPGRDLVTLITCHPYGKSYQRYVVYCERV